MPLPFPDALQEFRVATSGLSARERRALGRARSTRSPSRAPTGSHGNAFEFLRDTGSTRRAPFAPIGPDGKKLDDGLKRNQFGGTLGGPIVTDRLFFFGAYQGTTCASAPTPTHRVHADGRDAGRRLHGVRVAGLQRRPAGHAAGAVCRTTGSIRRSFSPAAMNIAQAAADDDRSVRRHQVSAPSSTTRDRSIAKSTTR